MGATAAAGSLTGASESVAQSAPALKVIDFHNHYTGSSWKLTTLVGLSSAARARWEKINTNLQSEKLLLDSIEAAGITARVLNTPTAFMEDGDGNIPPDAHRRINDGMAELVRKYPGKLYGLASVDAFSGDAGAREVTRAVRELGLRGIYLESAKRDLLLGAKETRPTLAAAASLGVPMFVHPQNDPQLVRRFSSTGRLGHSLSRGTINSAALVHMLETGMFEEVPKMQVVVSTWAFGGLLLAAGSRRRTKDPPRRP